MDTGVAPWNRPGYHVNMKLFLTSVSLWHIHSWGESLASLALPCPVIAKRQVQCERHMFHTSSPRPLIVPRNLKVRGRGRDGKGWGT